MLHLRFYNKMTFKKKIITFLESTLVTLLSKGDAHSYPVMLCHITHPPIYFLHGTWYMFVMTLLCVCLPVCYNSPPWHSSSSRKGAGEPFRPLALSTHSRHTAGVQGQTPTREPGGARLQSHPRAHRAGRRQLQTLDELLTLHLILRDSF